jgi:hypothetical protein
MPLRDRKGALNGQRRVGQSHDVASEQLRNEADPAISDRMAHQIADNNGSPGQPGPGPEQRNDFLLGKMMQQLRCKNEIKRSSAKRRSIAVAADNRNPATPKIPLFPPLPKGDERGFLDFFACLASWRDKL